MDSTQRGSSTFEPPLGAFGALPPASSADGRRGRPRPLADAGRDFALQNPNGGVQRPPIPANLPKCD